MAMQSARLARRRMRAAADALTPADDHLVSDNSLPSHTVRRFCKVFDTWDERGDSNWPLQEIRTAQLFWVRSILRNYTHCLCHETFDVVQHRDVKPPSAQAFTYGHIWLSGQVLFWEAVRRTLFRSSLSDDRKMRCKVQLICNLVDTAETNATWPVADFTLSGPWPIMSTSVLSLFLDTPEELGSALAPFMDEISSTVWLAREVRTVCEPYYFVLDDEATTRYNEVYNELFGFPPEGGGGASLSHGVSHGVRLR